MTTLGNMIPTDYTDFSQWSLRHRRRNCLVVLNPFQSLYSHTTDISNYRAICKRYQAQQHRWRGAYMNHYDSRTLSCSFTTLSLNLNNNLHGRSVRTHHTDMQLPYWLNSLKATMLLSWNDDSLFSGFEIAISILDILCKFSSSLFFRIKFLSYDFTFLWFLVYVW